VTLVDILVCSMHDVLCSEIKERIKKTKDEKRAKKAEVTAKVQKSSKGSVPKGAAPKGPKLGGGGGKR
jgi:large subunit ribosomal protein L24e